MPNQIQLALVTWENFVKFQSRAKYWIMVESLTGEKARLKTTRYFEEQVLRKRPYIRREWCQRVLDAPLRREVQSNGRIRFWGKVTLAGEVRTRFLRVVTLEDGETVLNAFLDRNFREDRR
jgi:hypothetical protein